MEAIPSRARLKINLERGKKKKRAETSAGRDRLWSKTTQEGADFQINGERVL